MYHDATGVRMLTLPTRRRLILALAPRRERHGQMLRPDLLAKAPHHASRHARLGDPADRLDMDADLRRAPGAHEPARLRRAEDALPDGTRPGRKPDPAAVAAAPLHADLREQGRGHGLLEPAPALPDLDDEHAARGARGRGRPAGQVPGRAPGAPPPRGLREAGGGEGRARRLPERVVPRGVPLVGRLAL